MHTRLTTTHRRLFAVVRTIALATALLATASAGAQTTLVDTGQPANTSGGHALWNTNPPLGMNFLGCKFTQASTFTIGTVQAWMVRPTGNIVVKLRANAGTIPGAELASASYPSSFAGPTAQWTTFGGLSWSQPAGTYWICFEPTFNTTNGSMPGNAPSPLPATAYFTTGNPNWVVNSAGDVAGRYGMKLLTPAPPPTILVPAQHATIQAAINAATLPNTEILVSPGTYNEAINYTGKNINLRSSAGAATTTINATGLNLPVVRIPAGSTSGTRLEGFTLTGGSALTGAAEGGGVMISGSTASIVACTMTNNDADSGGGASMTASANATFQNCTFSNNDAESLGGGAYLNGATATFSGCEFNGNHATAGDGGGLNINNNAQATLTNCTFSGNTASNAAGAALIIGTGASGSFSQCTFELNTAVQAGGVMVNSASASFTSCLFDDNTATFAGLTSGGGLQAQGSGTLSLTLCSFYSNQAENGAGVQLLLRPGTTTIAGCTFDGNIADVFGGGLHCRDSAATMSNTEFYDNEASFGGGVYVGGTSNLGVATSVFCDNLPDGLNGTYTNNGGNFLSCPEPGDTDGNGIVNVGDLLSVINAWGGCPALPAACPADLDDNGVVSVLDLLMVINNWS